MNHPSCTLNHGFKQLNAHLYPCVHFINVWDAAKDGFNLFLSKDGAPNLPFFLQWILEKLKLQTEKTCTYKTENFLKSLINVSE